MPGFAPIFTVEQIRRIEQAASCGTRALMERAGLAAAEHARELLGDTGRRVLAVAGPGNNGGDAFEAAVQLKRWFYRVALVFAGDEAKLSDDARAALAAWRGAGGAIERGIPSGERFDLVVDGLFGVGLARPLAGEYAALVEKMNALGAPILAIDVPSGLNASTGAAMGIAVRARRTLALISYKPGLLTLDGPDHCGELKLERLGLDPERTLAPEGELLDARILDRALKPRPRNFHKGMAGSVGVLGGAVGMTGAALIAARAALRCGAGRVYAGLLAPRAPALDPQVPELMMRAPRELLDGRANVLAVGPGMGTSRAARELLRAALRSQATLVLDADALNLLASDRTLRAVLAKRRAATLLTPHPAEAARLLGEDTRAVQSDRLAAARRLAERYAGFAVLKGNGSVIAAPDGRFWINPSGNPGMASAGMGDALTGIVASLAAQGAEPLAALLAGVWLHGAAADELLAAGRGPIGITASDVIEAAQRLINRRTAH